MTKSYVCVASVVLSKAFRISDGLFILKMQIYWSMKLKLFQSFCVFSNKFFLPCFNCLVFRLKCLILPRCSDITKFSRNILIEADSVYRTFWNAALRGRRSFQNFRNHITSLNAPLHSTPIQVEGSCETCRCSGDPWLMWVVGFRSFITITAHVCWRCLLAWFRQPFHGQHN